MAIQKWAKLSRNFVRLARKLDPLSRENLRKRKNFLGVCVFFAGDFSKLEVVIALKNRSLQ